MFFYFYFFVFFLLFFFFFFFCFCQKHLIVTSDVIICTGYTKFANTSEFVTVHIQNSKNKCFVKVKELAVCLLG